MEPAVIIMMLSVFFLLLSITVGLYSPFCGLSVAGDVRRARILPLEPASRTIRTKSSHAPSASCGSRYRKSTARRGFSSLVLLAGRVPLSDSWPALDLSESVSPSSPP